MAPRAQARRALCLWIHPMLAGIGSADDRVFGDGLNQRLELVDTNPLGSGVAVLTYRANSGSVRR